MARRKVIWSASAKSDRIQILRFWIDHNQSATYSRKLNILFKEATIFISHYPKVGKLVEDRRARIKIVSHYFLVYDISETTIIVLAIFDSRQDPIKLDF